jgi:hypothetical protein
MPQIPPLFFQKCRFSLEVTSPMLLPEYKGSTFRGGLMEAFKKVVCPMPPGRCETCLLPKSCGYCVLFESHELPSGRSVSMPYIIEPPRTEQKEFNIGNLLEFSTVLVGKAINYWKFLIFAVNEHGRGSGLGRRINGRRGRYRLKQVDSVGLHGKRVLVYSDEGEFGHSQPLTLSADEINSDTGAMSSGTQAVLNFLTPVCFIENVASEKYLITTLNFKLMMEKLIGRLGDLSEAYCFGQRPKLGPLFGEVPDIRLTKHTLKRQDIERYSRRQDQRYQLSGLKGAMWLEGHLEPFLPYLRLGEWLHVGKQTTFGFGQYQLITD